MQISSASFYSGHNNIHSSKKNNNKSLQQNQSEETSSLANSKTKASQAISIDAAVYQQQRVFKDKLTYTNQKALNEYHNLELMERKQQAQNALGFSAYA